jgi:hypothetical protein
MTPEPRAGLEIGRGAATIAPRFSRFFSSSDLASDWEDAVCSAVVSPGFCGAGAPPDCAGSRATAWSCSAWTSGPENKRNREKSRTLSTHSTPRYLRLVWHSQAFLLRIFINLRSNRGAPGCLRLVIPCYVGGKFFSNFATPLFRLFRFFCWLPLGFTVLVAVPVQTNCLLATE